MDSESDLVLIRRLQDGDAAAFERLVDLYLPAISRYVSRMTGNPAEAEDLTQEVFIRLWQKSSRFDPKLAKLNTWLHQIAHNLCIDYFRRQQPVEYSETEEGISEESPDLDLQYTRDQQRLTDAMLKLPERQRSAILLCHHQGHSNIQAAQIMEISVDALESLLSRGRRKLKQLLQEHPS